MAGASCGALRGFRRAHLHRVQRLQSLTSPPTPDIRVGRPHAAAVPMPMVTHLSGSGGGGRGSGRATARNISAKLLLLPEGFVLLGCWEASPGQAPETARSGTGEPGSSVSGETAGVRARATSM